ncbi:hypothetical protein Ahy_B02g058933 [Arachis hypogaea]|uniref:Uncharacterized protein n=1 Tax=Arachis hypogaea TaxID=3818 RepID=A0A445AFS3_ARAHY|nr:hypothetical protein Ahy_B02g058933 [Arachis hypogaea]
MSNTEAEHRKEEEAPAGEDEDTGAQVAPIVRLEEVAVSTGEYAQDLRQSFDSTFDECAGALREREIICLACQRLRRW